ncbi:serine/threonine protein kinase [Actinoallomurus soli]|uniref:serine/threonine protein kinase n=1 Tax=Actinoallomurus soli TaxID=2952535 RepID=UPI0020928C9E|nr:serine/threonine-protein kinase [Actinoallomurus soli]MCO5966816.1 protein kinase [Actinoallomurus soli]
MPNVQPLTNGDPRRLGAYEVIGRLGEGGQGIVYLGRGADGSVAIKVLQSQLMEDAGAKARFVREVEVTKRVARFCTAQVLDVGMADDRPYIVSEYVPGPSLQDQLRQEGPRQGATLDRLAINTATALAAIHQAGVVHRDFKPGNVLMGPDGPVVIDFGIARALDATGTAAASQVVGTPAFMAPEQLADGRVGPATDIFAWGVTMVCAATGTPPFGNKSIPTVIHRILHEEPDLGALDGRLRNIVAACLAKDPARRPTARQLMDALMGQQGATGLLDLSGAPGAPMPGMGAVPPAGVTGGATEVLPPGGRPGGATEVLPPAGPQGAGTRVLPPAGPQGAGTMRMPPAGPPTASTRRMPPHGPGSAGGYHPSGGGTYDIPPVTPPPPAYGHEPMPRRRGGGGVIAAVIAGVILLGGGGVVYAATHFGGDGQNTAEPSPSTKKHKAKRSHTPAHRPTRKKTPSHTPTPKKTVRANPYTPERLCGPGFHTIESHGLGEATVHLLYNDASGANCVVTMVPKSNGDKTRMTATLAVKDGGQGSRSAANPFFAGPVRLPAKGKCVRWGGSSPTGAWTSGWTHCH